MGNESSSGGGGNDSSSSSSSYCLNDAIGYDACVVSNDRGTSSSSSSSIDYSGANDDRPCYSSSSSSSSNYCLNDAIGYNVSVVSNDYSGANDDSSSYSSSSHTSTSKTSGLDIIGSAYAARHDTYAANASMGHKAINAGAKAVANSASIAGKTVFESGYHNINTRIMESQATNKFIREQVTADRVITGVGVATDIASKSVGGLASTAATMAVATQNDKFSQRSTAEQRFDTTVGAIGAGAAAMTMFGIGATIAAPIALGAGGALAAKEGAKMIHNLDNQAINNINNHTKNDPEGRKALLDLHDKARIPH